jgi:cell division protein FtsB
MVKRREDSIKEMNKRKSNEQLTKENRELRAKVADLQTQVEEQADALIELAAMIGGGG